MKCSICDREVNDDVKICPNCGHNFDFKYKYNGSKFHEQFDYETMQEQYDKAIEERIEKYNNAKSEKEIENLEADNRIRIGVIFGYALQIGTIFNLITYSTTSHDSWFLYYVLINGLFLLITTTVCFAISRKNKKLVVGDIMMLSMGIFVYNFIVGAFYYSTTINEYTIISSLVSLVLGFVLLFIYTHKKKKTFPVYLFAAFISVSSGILMVIIRILLNSSKSVRYFVDDNLGIITALNLMIISFFIGAVIAIIVFDVKKAHLARELKKKKKEDVKPCSKSFKPKTKRTWIYALIIIGVVIVGSLTGLMIYVINSSNNNIMAFRGKSNQMMEIKKKLSETAGDAYSVKFSEYGDNSIDIIKKETPNSSGTNWDITSMMTLGFDENDTLEDVCYIIGFVDSFDKTGDKYDDILRYDRPSKEDALNIAINDITSFNAILQAPNLDNELSKLYLPPDEFKQAFLSTENWEDLTNDNIGYSINNTNGVKAQYSLKNTDLSHDKMGMISSSLMLYVNR